MKVIIAVCSFALIALAVARPGEHYTDKYDNINVKEIMENRILLKKYVDCALDRGPCTADIKELKSHVGDALANKCAKCTDKQKEGVKTVLHHLVNFEPGYWKELCDKYDPDGVYAKEYEKELKEASG